MIEIEKQTLNSENTCQNPKVTKIKKKHTYESQKLKSGPEIRKLHVEKPSNE